MANKLEQEIADILQKVCFNCDEHTDELYSLTADVAQLYSSWCIRCELRGTYGSADNVRHSENELFTYFIENIYA